MTVVRRLVAVVLVSLCFQVVLAGPLDNCQEYVRYGTPSDQGDLLCRTGYALAHNPEHKTPDWVAERLTREKATAVRARSNDFRPDPDLAPGRRAELSDYQNSGYDRGGLPARALHLDVECSCQILLHNLNFSALLNFEFISCPRVCTDIPSCIESVQTTSKKSTVRFSKM